MSRLRLVRRPAVLASLVCAGLAAAVLLRAQPAPPSYAVVRVVDGDTLILEDLGRVRLIGVDTPESVDPRRPVQHFGREASAFLNRLVGGRRVRVEYDGARKDVYDRTLAYVFLLDGTFVNAEIVRQGYGFAYTRFPYRHAGTFRRYEREAREARRGLWAADPPPAAAAPAR